ncbi:MalY/PatB family protein [Shewanella goraebulensis]|uniref:MalY/PatB family protein n=1 Tax=Shewanella goraebulensis TaxID=3050637 RepID=UPI00254FBFF4|nr:PatB family C-S lyase [Shewanella goraebulensis]
MTQFNSASQFAENNFIKSKPEMLNNFYGTTDVFPYWVADMDFSVAEPISNELSRLVERGVYSYEFNEQAVFSAISNWHAKRHDISLNPENFVQVPGVLSGIALLLRELTNEGDAVLIHTPAYHQFANLITKADRKVVKNELVIADDKYQIDFDAFEAQIKRQNVKAMIFCNPHNPTGRVWTQSELAKVVEIAKRHNVMIISDEIHSDIIFKGHQFTSLTSFDYDNVVTLIGSPAKTFGMHSISNGYIYTNNATMLTGIKKLIGALYLDHGNALTTFATIAAYEKGAEWVDEMLAYLEQTVSWITEFAAQHIPQLKVYKPEGTYQIWFDFSALGLSEQRLKEVVFKQAKMGLTPGNWFGAQSPQFMRMNIATSRENICASFELLKAALEQVDSSPAACCSSSSSNCSSPNSENNSSGNSSCC